MQACPVGSLDDVERSFPGAIELLGVMAFLAPAPLPWTLLETLARSVAPGLADAFADQGRRREMLAALTEGAHVNADERSLTLAESTAGSIRRGLPADDRRRHCQAALELLLAFFPEDAELPIRWPLCQALAVHVAAVHEHAEQLNIKVRDANTLLVRLSLYELSRGHLATSMDLARRVVGTAEELNDQELLGLSLHTLGRALCENGDSEQSKAELERALEIHRTILPDGAVATRIDEYTLAYVLGDLGEYAEALGYLEQLDADIEDHPDRHHCRALRIRGAIQLEADEIDAALADFLASLALAERILGDGDPEGAEAHGGAGMACRRKGELDAALQHAEAAVQSSVAVLGPDHPDVAIFRSGLADVLFDRGDYQRARPELEAALGNGEVVLSSNHRGLWIRHTKLANLLQRTGDLAEARRHSEAALAVSERAHGAESAEVADDLARLTQILLRLGELSAARDTASRGLAIRRADENTDRRVLAAVESSLGKALIGLGELPRAREHLQSALRTYEAEAGGDERTTLMLRLDLHMLLARMGDELSAAYRALGQEAVADALAEHSKAGYVEAIEPLLKGATQSVLLTLASRSTAIAPDLAHTALERASADRDDDPAIRMRLAGAWHQLGRTRAANKERSEAERAFTETLPLLESEPQSAGVVLHDMADLRILADEPEEAAELYRRGAERKREAGDRGNPRDLATTLHALGRTLEAKGSLEEALSAYTERLAILRGLPEQDHVAVSIALRDIGDVHRARGELARAIESYELALQHAGECDDTRATERRLEILRVLASTQIKVAEPDRAIVTLRERLEILESLPDRRSEEEAYTLHTIGAALTMVGDLEEALRCFEHAGELQSQVEVRESPDDPVGRAATLFGAAVARGIGSRDSAVLAREVADLVRPLDTRDHYLFVSALALQAAGAASDGESEEARRVLAEADRALPKAPEAPTLEVVNPILILADAHRLAGQDKRATRLRKQALAMLERMVAEHTTPSGELLSLNASCIEVGATELAEQVLANAREAAESDPRLRHMLARMLGHVGRAYELRLHDYENAHSCYQESLSVLRSLEEPDLVAESTTLRDLADVHRHRGELTQAIACYEGSLTGAQEAGNQRGVASTLLGLGRALVATGRQDEALEAFQRRTEILRAQKRPEPQAIGVTLHDIADIYQKRSDLQEAIRLYRESAKLKQEADAPKRDLITTLLRLATVELAAADPDAAQSARRVVEMLRGESPPDEKRLSEGLVLEARLTLGAGEGDRALALLTEAEGLLGDDDAPPELRALIADARALVSST